MFPKICFMEDKSCKKLNEKITGQINLTNPTFSISFEMLPY